MKFATPIGALSGNKVQVILPTDVSITATGFAGAACTTGLAAVLGVAAGLAAGAACVLVLDCAHTTLAAIIVNSEIANPLRMNAPWKLTKFCAQRCIVRQRTPLFPHRDLAETVGALF